MTWSIQNKSNSDDQAEVFVNLPEFANFHRASQVSRFSPPVVIVTHPAP